MEQTPRGFLFIFCSMKAIKVTQKIKNTYIIRMFMFSVQWYKIFFGTISEKNVWNTWNVEFIFKVRIMEFFSCFDDGFGWNEGGFYLELFVWKVSENTEKDRQKHIKFICNLELPKALFKANPQKSIKLLNPTPKKKKPLHLSPTHIPIISLHKLKIVIYILYVS